MAITDPLRVSKRITSCKARDHVLAEGDVIQYTIEIQNPGITTAVGFICDEIPEDLFESIAWEDSQGATGDTFVIENEIKVEAMGEYELTINLVVGPIDPCLGRTFTNVAEFKPNPTEAEPCPKSHWAKADTCHFGCEEPRYDPCFGTPGDLKMLALLLDFNEFQWCQAIDAINAGTAGIPGLPGTDGEDGLDGATINEICDLLIEKLEEGTPDNNAFKDAIVACINETITKEFMAAVFQEGN